MKIKKDKWALAQSIGILTEAHYVLFLCPPAKAGGKSLSWRQVTKAGGN
jgi:hypothetical protein